MKLKLTKDFWGAAAFALFPVFVSILAIVIMSLGNEPTVVHHGGYPEKGIPTEWDIYASYAKVWLDAQPAVWVIILAWIIGMGPGIYAIVMDYTLDTLSGWKYVGIILICWVLCGVLQFARTVTTHNSSSYHARISDSTYQKLQLTKSLDSLFPKVETGKED